ncbi:MAG: translocation/assembly module TamB domain-containing protein, partial [Pseudomonadota bacterium]
FDLRLDGPARLDALSGTITTEQGRVALPGSGLVLQDLSGRVDLAQGQARPDITGNAGTGGSFRVTGPITLSTPFPATLQASLNDLGVSDPNLYRTTVSGQVTVDGALTGGARIGGVLSLGETEVMVPSSTSAAPGSILDMRHVNTPADVRLTQERAGLTGQKSKGPSAVFPLDLTINAPNRIFVRGRGLDAELGGRLRLGGTTANVTASGVFELIRGRLDILGRRLDLTQGLIDLRGALDPFLRFVAETQSDDFLVRIILEGLASDPTVRFESEPDLPQEEAVARLLFGRGLDSISPFQAAQLVAAAATLSGQSSGGLSGSLRKSLGLSDLDVTTTEDGANQVRAGTYIDENIYSEVVVDSEGNQEINLNLDINKNLTVRGGTSNDGNTGVGVFFEKDY